MALELMKKYTIGWICALPLEMTAALAILDKRHPVVPQHPSDSNTYQFGQIGEHNVVIACLPPRMFGVVSAATAAAQMLRSFESLRFGLMVGIGGGVPGKADIRLGDVVVSEPTQAYGGVLQYDYGKTVQESRFIRTGTLNKPPIGILNAVSALKAEHLTRENHIGETISELLKNGLLPTDTFRHPGVQTDKLFRADYDHPETSESSQDMNCDSCDSNMVINRPARRADTSHIHYGLIASGNQVMKHAKTRDNIARETGAICFEMEAAGLMDHFPCLVVRGISDYCDSHKNKHWQPYAALAAAAFAKELLHQIPLTVSTGATLPLSTSSRIINIPRILHSHFSGRQTYLDQLRKFFDPASTTKEGAIASVYGTPGIGKSQLCLKYADTNSNNYNYIFYASAGTEEQWITDCEGIIRTLDLSKSAKQENRLLALKNWLARESKFLLIIDNLTPSIIKHLQNLIPQHLNGHILISTRDKFIAKRLSTESGCIHLREMDPSESKNLVLKIFEIDSEDHKAAEFSEKIGRELDGLPLALEQAATCAVQRHWQLDRLLDMVKENKRDLLQRAEEEPLHLDTVTTLEIALKELKPEHCALLTLIIMLRPQELPVALITDGANGLSINMEPLKSILTSDIELDDALLSLERSSLVIREQGKIWVHDLFHELIKGELKDDRAKDFMTLTGQIICNAFPEPSYDNWGTCNLYLPHSIDVMLLLSAYDTPSREVLNTIRRIASYYNGVARYEEALEWFERALPGCENTLGKEHPVTLDVVHGIASVFFNQGKYDDAMKWYQRALAGYEKALGEEHPSTLGTVHGIGLIFDNQGHDPMQWFQRALGGYEKALGKEHPSALETINNIASNLHRQGDNDGAMQLYRRALVGYEKVLGKEHPSTLRTLRGMALVFNSKGRYDEAMRLYQRALAGYEKALGKEHPSTLRTLHGMAFVFYGRGRYDEAMQLYQQALAGREKTLGKEHPLTMDTVRCIGLIFNNQGKYDKALQWHQRALAGYEKFLGKEHPSTLETMHNIASIFSNQGKDGEATEWYQRLPASHGKNLSTNQPTIYYHADVKRGSGGLFGIPGYIKQQVFNRLNR
ncbi:hypothetical protein TWF694_004288 [Orbilia ellipsospora]|uniref:Kinesin light chain n=1 Tax=Orbilia ellipsospora TaxID=2528407 RepID=A0AAV9WYN1_9PEZI